MQAMAKADPRIKLARRVITRPADAGGEVFDSVGMPIFEQMKDEGKFAIWWAAHGLHYGIPTTVNISLKAGHDVLANLSRGVLEHAQSQFEQFHVIALNADHEVLRQRLQTRGREDKADIAGRLKRAAYVLPETIPATELDNSGPLEHTVRHALDVLYPKEGERHVR